MAVKSEELVNINQDYSAFKEHLNKAKKQFFCSFPSLKKDIKLIVPIPCENENNELLDYKNISEFAKNAPFDQFVELWSEAARVLEEELEDDKIIGLSTHGLGVYYLHVRIDINPTHYDYYQCEKYTKILKEEEASIIASAICCFTL